MKTASRNNAISRINAGDLKTIAARRPDAFVVAADHYGSQQHLYGPFVTKPEAMAFGESEFGGVDWTSAVAWMVYDISAAVDQFAEQSVDRSGA